MKQRSSLLIGKQPFFYVYQSETAVSRITEWIVEANKYLIDNNGKISFETTFFMTGKKLLHWTFIHLYKRSKTCVYSSIKRDFVPWKRKQFSVDEIVEKNERIIVAFRTRIDLWWIDLALHILTSINDKRHTNCKKKIKGKYSTAIELFAIILR